LSEFGSKKREREKTEKKKKKATAMAKLAYLLPIT
jgi:hypothetical protein